MRLSRENSGAIVPYLGGASSSENLNISAIATTTLMKRESIVSLKKDADGIISLSDVDDDHIEQMILTEEESRLKKVIWNNLNKDWIREQKKRKRENKEKRKIDKQKKKTIRNIKSKCLFYMVDW